MILRLLLIVNSHDVYTCKSRLFSIVVVFDRGRRMLVVITRFVRVVSCCWANREVITRSLHVTVTRPFRWVTLCFHIVQGLDVKVHVMITRPSWVGDLRYSNQTIKSASTKIDKDLLKSVSIEIFLNYDKDYNRNFVNN